jgi:hypothetical protein
MTDQNNLPTTVELAEVILSNEVVERHSLFQLQCFVLAKEPTIQGKLHQCLREIKSRKMSLDALKLEVEEQEDALELIDLDISDVGKFNLCDKRKELKVKSLQRRHRSVEYNLKNLKKKQKDISDEMLFFCSAFDQLNRREKLKPWDDVEVQKEYWNEKLRFEINTRLMLRQLPDVELMRTILCLHDDATIKQATIKMLKQANEQAAQAQQAIQNQG